MLERILLSLLLLLCFPALSNAAGAFRFAPTSIEIPSARGVGTTTLYNRDAEPLYFQIRIFKWSQVDGRDTMEPADDSMVVSPPAITIQPGNSFTVRIARRDSGPVGQEQSYRLVIDQLALPEQGSGDSLGVSVLFRASLPVYVTDAKAEAKLEWRVWRDDNDNLRVDATNSGSRRIRIATMSLQPEDGPALSFNNILEGVAGAMLAGTTKQFGFKPAEGESMPRLRSGSQVRITVNEAAEQPLTYVVDVE